MTIATVAVVRTLVPVILALQLWAPPAAAQTFTSGTDADNAELRALARLFEDAVRQHDLKKFQNALAPDFVATLVTNENANRESMAKFWDWVWGLIGRNGRWETKVDPEASRFFGDIAVARGVTSDAITTEKGREYRYSWNWTLVLQKRDGRWTPVAGHGSLDPLGNPFVAAEKSWLEILFGGGGALAGLVVGAVVTGLVMRRRRGTTRA